VRDRHAITCAAILGVAAAIVWLAALAVSLAP
jgi:hypothetical protein